MSLDELKEKFTYLRQGQALEEAFISLVRSLCSQNDYGDALEARMLDYCDKRHLDGAELDGILKAISDAETPPPPLPPSQWLGHDYIPDFGKFDGAIVVPPEDEWSTLNDNLSLTPIEVLAVKGRIHLESEVKIGTLLVYPGGEVTMHPGAMITIRDLPFYPFEQDPKRWSNGIINLGYFATHGTAKTPFLRSIGGIVAGSSKLYLQSVPQGWNVGDEVLIPDTRQAVSQRGRHEPNINDEVRNITSINGNIITLSGILAYDHPGFIDGHTGLERFPHICNLTRDIVIRSENPNGNRGHFAWHMQGYVDLNYTEFRDLGRTRNDVENDETVIAEDGGILWRAENQRGRYPIHSHHSFGTPGGRTDSAFQSTVAGNVVRDSPSWGITIHGSHFIQVDKNIVYGATGAGIMEEDGTEYHNHHTENVVVACYGHEKPLFKKNVVFTDGTKHQWLTIGTNGSGLWIGRQASQVNGIYTYSSSGYSYYPSGYGLDWPSMDVATERGNPTKTRLDTQNPNDLGLEVTNIEAFNTRGALYMAWDRGPDQKRYTPFEIGQIVSCNTFGERGTERVYHTSQWKIAKAYYINDQSITDQAERTEPLAVDDGTAYDSQGEHGYLYVKGFTLGITPPTKGNKDFPHAPYYVRSGAIDCPVAVAFRNTEDGESGPAHIDVEILSGIPVRGDWKYDTQKIHAPFAESVLYLNGERFWFDVQSPDYVQPPDGKGKQVVIIDGERVDIVGMTSQEVFDEYGLILGGVFKDV